MFQLELAEDFDGDRLDESRWLPAHLPQWSSRAQAAARYDLEGGRLVLRIDRDQPPWCPEFDGATRVSSLQTGVLAGPLGSGLGQHRFNPDAVVREEQETRRLYTPTYGRIEARASALPDPMSMVAFWMIGFEEVPEQSAEICVFEIFGRDVRSDSADVSMGIHPFGDPALSDDFERVRVDIDVTRPHTYAVEWTPGRVRWLVDDQPVKTSQQAPDYALQLMLGIYEFPTQAQSAHPYPKRFEVEHVHGYGLLPSPTRSSPGDA